MDERKIKSQIGESSPLPMDSRRDDYMARMNKFTIRFNRALLSNFKYYLHVAGTNITVKRIENSEYKDALGAAYIFDGTETVDTEVKVFQKRLIFNRSLFVRNYRTTMDDIEAYTNEDFYKIGDQIEFNLFDINFKYKIVEIDQFDPYTKMLFKLTLSGFEEYSKS